jgi:hypothetical protein
MGFAGPGWRDSRKEGVAVNKPLRGALVATAVAGLFVAGKALAAEGGEKAAGAKVKCEGVNECKGHGACGGAGHDCAGKNECKGKGWVEMSSEADCKAKGGTVKQ